MVVKGKTKSGFEYEIDNDSINDMRFVELMAGVDENITNAVKAIDWMLGAEQKKKLYDFIAQENSGRVPVEEFSKMFEEILDDAAERTENIKNS